MRFNWHYVIYGLAGIGQITIGIRYIITQQTYGMITANYSGRPAVIAGILYLIAGIIFSIIPFLLKGGKRSKLQRVFEYVTIAVFIIALQRIALWFA